MKTNQGVIAALLGAALLAMPMTAAAHDVYRNHRVAPTYSQMTANNRPWMTPKAAPVRVADRDDWRWRGRDEWRNRNYYRDNYRPVARDDCRIVPPYNRYPNNYNRPGYYPEAYNYAGPNYRTPVRPGLANLIRERDNARLLYQQALRRGNHERAEHLRNDLAELNKRIAGVEQHG